MTSFIATLYIKWKDPLGGDVLSNLIWLLTSRIAPHSIISLFPKVIKISLPYISEQYNIYPRFYDRIETLNIPQVTFITLKDSLVLISHLCKRLCIFIFFEKNTTLILSLLCWKLKNMIFFITLRALHSVTRLEPAMTATNDVRFSHKNSSNLPINLSNGIPLVYL